MCVCWLCPLSQAQWVLAENRAVIHFAGWKLGNSLGQRLHRMLKLETDHFQKKKKLSLNFELIRHFYKGSISLNSYPESSAYLHMQPGYVLIQARVHFECYFLASEVVNM